MPVIWGLLLVAGSVCGGVVGYGRAMVRAFCFSGRWRSVRGSGMPGRLLGTSPFVGSVAERLRSGVAAAAEEDRRVFREVVFVSVGVDDSRGPFDHVRPVVGGCD